MTNLPAVLHPATSFEALRAIASRSAPVAVASPGVQTAIADGLVEHCPIRCAYTLTRDGHRAIASGGVDDLETSDERAELADRILEHRPDHESWLVDVDPLYAAEVERRAADLEDARVGVVAWAAHGPGDLAWADTDGEP